MTNYAAQDFLSLLLKVNESRVPATSATVLSVKGSHLLGAKILTFSLLLTALRYNLVLFISFVDPNDLTSRD